MYKSLKIQVSIQDIWTNASFIKAEGQNDELDVKKFSLFTFLRVKKIENEILCRRKKSKVTGGLVPNFPVPYCDKYWAVPNVLSYRTSHQCSFFLYKKHELRAKISTFLISNLRNSVVYR